MKVGVFSISPGALRCGLAGLALSGSMLAHAAGEYVLAHVAPFTGPVAFEAAEYNARSPLALEAANAARGGCGMAHEYPVGSTHTSVAPSSTA